MTKKKAVSRKSALVDPKGYAKLFEQLKVDIKQTQLRAALSVTKELILLYWRTGKALSEKVNNEGWGAKTMERLARDLKAEFPDVSGFSLRNLKYMRQFAESFPEPNWAAAAAQIPWGHNMLLLDKVNDPTQRLWYVQQAISGGWSRSTLETWIESNLCGRKGKALNNFKATLPVPQSDMAEQVLRRSKRNWQRLKLVTVPLQGKSWKLSKRKKIGRNKPNGRTEKFLKFCCQLATMTCFH